MESGEEMKSLGFIKRHIGPSVGEIQQMLKAVGYSTMDDFIKAAVPVAVRSKRGLDMAEGLSEEGALGQLRELGAKNKRARSFIGLGYYGCQTPTVIQRNILENPCWYTQYTPYQAEIAQGRLEALLNFQTMVCDLTGMPLANASLLDEATAAAEAMTMSFAVGAHGERKRFFVASNCFPQTRAVVKTRAEALGIEVIEGQATATPFDEVFGALYQYPGANGEVQDLSGVLAQAKAAGVITTVASDLLALTVLVPPGEQGADIVVGSAQRFGVPLGFGGPHAAFFATRDEYKRQIPGRIVGVSKDSAGRPALRLALQTREQHIRRDKATSNICTAQVLLAVMSGMYAVYHGPKELRGLAERINRAAASFASQVKELGYKVVSDSFFDTVSVRVSGDKREAILKSASIRNINLGIYEADSISVAFDEASAGEPQVAVQSLVALVECFAAGAGREIVVADVAAKYQRAVGAGSAAIPAELTRKSEFLTAAVFNSYHSETECLRYIKSLEEKDLSLAHGMIPLGSCTMKLNATSEMLPVSWPEFADIHPFAPSEQYTGYLELFKGLEAALCEVTGFAGVSLQPNAGSQGEYAGLLVIKSYLEAKGEGVRNICLIPRSAHGTNPASAVMAGFQVVGVDCDEQGNVDLQDLRAKVDEYRDQVGALMVTYPSTHGVFEAVIKEVTSLVRQAGGQVYMDGANLNALVGLAKPEELGMDVCHINLHKTFCIPHGGGGPGMGPIAVAKHLVPHLPKHDLVAAVGGAQGCGAVSAAPWGSALILVIPWMYIKMMGGVGLKMASEVAILNANYVSKRLESYFPTVYRGENGLVAHECILDLRGAKDVGIEVEDVAKRLMDYGFHAPTVSWPVAGTLMVEPTESEGKAELDRFCDAMISIAGEIERIRTGSLDKANNPLKRAPHTALDVISDSWDRPYGREEAAFPTKSVKARKFWPACGRIDSVYGDRNLICACSNAWESAK